MNKDKLNSQARASIAVKRKYYVIASVDKDGNFSVANNPVMHTTHVAAQTECNRLASTVPGKMFIVLQLVSGAVAAVLTVF